MTESGTGRKFSIALIGTCLIVDSLVSKKTKTKKNKTDQVLILETTLGRLERTLAPPDLFFLSFPSAQLTFQLLYSFNVTSCRHSTVQTTTTSSCFKRQHVYKVCIRQLAGKAAVTEEYKFTH